MNRSYTRAILLTLTWTLAVLSWGVGTAAAQTDEAALPEGIPTVRWEEGKDYSGPPALMGRQMGEVHTLNVPPLGYELQDGVKVFTLVAQPVRHSFTGDRPAGPEVQKAMARMFGRSHADADNWKASLWGYNGSVPGPTIECRRGDRVRIVLRNELPQATSLHVHGLFAPPVARAEKAHGVVPPGEERIYEIQAEETGTFLYHSGVNMTAQMGLGLGGLFVVHPRKEQPVDKEFALVLQAWAFHPDNTQANLATDDFNFLAFGGKTAPYVDTLSVRKGDRVRIRIGNLSMATHPIYVQGHRFTIVGTEGGPIPPSARRRGATISLPPGTTRDIEFTARHAGNWAVFCHRLHHVVSPRLPTLSGFRRPGGMFTLLRVQEADTERSSRASE